MIDWLFITAAHAATAEGGGHHAMRAVSTPWSSSTSSGTCRYPSGRLRRLLHQLRALDGDGNPARPGLLHAQHEGRQPRSHPDAVRHRACLRVRRQHGPAERGQRRHGVFPDHLHDLPLRAGDEPARHDPAAEARQLHGDEPHHRHLRARHVRVGRRHADRHPQARLEVLQAVRAVGRPRPASAAHQRDRDHLLLHPPHQPLRPSVRQHDGRAHDARRVRQLRRRAWHPGRLAPASASWWRSWGSKS